MRIDIGRSIMVRVLERGHSNAERMSPTDCLEGHTLLKTYHWQPQAGVYQQPDICKMTSSEEEAFRQYCTACRYAST